MESKNQFIFDIKKSAQRMDDILSNSNCNFSDEKEIPSRDKLTYTNGFYVNVSAIFIDIVGSSSMTDSHKRPTLAKMYRSFISECVALLNSCNNCKEINIHGDCVWGVFDTPYPKDIDDIFNVAAKINSMIKVLNYKLSKKGYSEISIGIGIDYGRALMVKAGYSGSSINDVVWMGDVINSASHICNIAGRNGRKSIVVSQVIYNNLNEENQKLLSRDTDTNTKKVFYESNQLNSVWEEWYDENCK